MHYGIITIALLVSFSTTRSYSQTDPNYLFKTLTFRERLSHSHVTSMAQDSLGYLWLGTENGLNRYDGIQTVVFKHIAGDSTSLLNSDIRKVFLDSQQRMWLITASGVCRYRPISNDFIAYPFNAAGDHQGDLPQDIIESPAGQILVLSHYNTVSLFSEEHRRFEKLMDIRVEASAQSLGMYRGRLFVGAQRWLLEVDPQTGEVVDTYELYDASHPLSSSITQLTVVNDRLWIAGSMMHLHCFDPVARTLARIDTLPYTTSVASVTDQVLFVGSLEGSFLYDVKAGKAVPLHSVDHDSFLENIVKVFVDKDHNLWAANQLQGVVHTAGQRIFRDIRHLNPELAPYAREVSSLQIIAHRQLWLGLNTGQVLAVNLADRQYQRLGHAPKTSLPPGKGTVFDIFEDSQQRVWVGSYEGGLRRYNTRSENFVASNATTDSLRIRSDDIRSIAEDTQGRLWLATHGRGVDVYDPDREEVIASYGLSAGDTDPYISDWTFQLVTAPDSAVWIASSSGLQMIKETTKKYFQHHPEQPGSLSNDKVTSLLRDARGNLWVGTAEGLNVLNPEDSSFIKFTTQQGLSDDYVSSVAEDASGNLWIGTSDGLSCLSYPTTPKTATIQRIELPDGQYSHQFIDRASTIDAAGNLYFATTHGVLTFNPQDLIPANRDPEVFLTSFEVFQSSPQENKPAQTTSSWQGQPINRTKRVTLESGENTVSIGFSAIDFAHSDQIRYQYRLKGHDHRWIAGKSRSVTYYDLPAGEYQFEVKATLANATDVFSGKTLAITIKQPWYYTTAGMVGMAMLLLIFVSLGGYLLRERIRLKNQARLNEKDHEIDQLKIKFFMNISHEFRTPLTLISGPLEKLIQSLDGHPAQQYLYIIQRNAQRLSRLVNQLLDLRKLEQRRYQLRVAEGELAVFVRNVYQSFQYLAQQREIDYWFTNNTRALGATWFDTDVLDKILYNFLSNAFKYTPDHGQINIIVSDHPTQPHWALITVTDTGIGIEAAQLANIFDRFYRVEAAINPEGTGIGLSLCQELAHLHRGKITVTSTPKQGSTFAVALPTRAEDYSRLATGLGLIPKATGNPYATDAAPFLARQAVEPSNLLSPSKSRSDQRPLVLIVDDNTDLLLFIQESLVSAFTVITAQNGRAAFQKAVEAVPDVVVSDVMMPVMDGLQLAEQLKADMRTSHIPVVLLTARASEQCQVDGLRIGADDYIIKPFSVTLLTAKLHSLVANRARLQARFADADGLGIQQQVRENSENAFLLKLTALIDENMENDSWETDDICRAVGMSRSQLYRKLSAVTGQSVHDFVKLYRLARAAELLGASAHTVTEVASLTGFKYVQSFTRSFKDHYGCTPRQYAKSRSQRV